MTKSFLYDGVNVVQEQAGETATANILTGGIDEFFSRTDSSGTWSPIADALGSIVALTDSAGTVQTSYTFEPFGQTTATGTTSSNPSKFTAREDDGSGLYYYRARYYYPSLQRFTSEDPSGIDGGINYYEYAGNDPINEIDPFGLSPQSGGVRRFKWKDGRERGDFRRGPRIGGKHVPQCDEDDTCPQILYNIGGLNISIQTRYLARLIYGNIDQKHRGRIAEEEDSLRNCLWIYADKVNKGECECTPTARRRYERGRERFRDLPPLRTPRDFHFPFQPLPNFPGSRPRKPERVF